LLPHLLHGHAPDASCVLQLVAHQV
jgi:hypothetical protein